MITFLFIILVIVSATMTSAGLIVPFETGKIRYILLFFIGIVMIIGTVCFGNSYLLKIPTKQDVLNGKAYYQETQIITGNDTIKTYDIVWK